MYKAIFVVVSVPTNGSNEAFNVVIWLSFLSVKFFQSTIYLSRIVLNGIKKVEKWLPRYSCGHTGEWSWSATWLSIVCNNNVFSCDSNQRKKSQQWFLYRLLCKARGKNQSNMKSFNRNSIYDSIPSLYQKVYSRPHDLYWCGTLEMFLALLLYNRICLRTDVFKLNCCLNILFIIWFLYVLCFINVLQNINDLQNTDPVQREVICSFADKQLKFMLNFA